MKELRIMMAKELLELQIQQIRLRQEELSLHAKVIELDLKLGLCTLDWYEGQKQKILAKGLIYRDLIDDYETQTNAIAKAEQAAVFVGDDDHMKEDNAFLGDDIPKEEATDTSYEVVEDELKKFPLEEKEEGDHFKIVEEKKNVLKKN